MKKFLVLLICILFFAAATAVCEDSYLITAPDGAPAVAAAGIFADHPDRVRKVAADTIAVEFANEESEFIIAPINAGAKLFRAGKSTYRLAAVVTWGNLVFASQKEGFEPDMINGAKLTLFGENTINASIALFILQNKGIVPSEIEYLAGAKNTQDLLMTDPEAIVMTAEPAATAAKMKNEAVKTFSLNELYKDVTGFDGFTQAGLFVREKDILENPEETNARIAEIKASVERVEADPESTAADAVAMEILPNAKVALNAIPNCAIRYANATEAKEQIETTALIDLAQFGGEVPADDFYYAAE